MLFEENALSFLQLPTSLAFFTMAYTWNTVLGDEIISEIFPINISRGKMIRIFREPPAPSTEHNRQILLNFLSRIKIRIYDFIFLCKTKIMSFLVLSCNSAHSFEVFRVNDISRTVPAYKPRQSCLCCDAVKEKLRIFCIVFKIFLR